MIKEFVLKRIATFRGVNWTIDKSVSSAYLFSFIFSRSIMLLRGFCIFPFTKKRVFVGHRTVVKAKSYIKWQGNLFIGDDCYIDALSHKGIVFGENVSMRRCTTVECSGSLKEIGVGLIVGSNVGLGSHGFLGCAGGVVIGENTIFGNYVSLHSENHNYDDKNTPIRLQGVNHRGIVVGKDCWVGAKVTILDGAIVGNGCIVAAGAVVTKGNYPDYSIIGGVPAKIIGCRK